MLRGAPGGITFGLKQIFKDNVHCFFVEPVQALCMLASMVIRLNRDIFVKDIGLSGKTHADGLAGVQSSKDIWRNTTFVIKCRTQSASHGRRGKSGPGRNPGEVPENLSEMRASPPIMRTSLESVSIACWSRGIL